MCMNASDFHQTWASGAELTSGSDGINTITGFQRSQSVTLVHGLARAPNQGPHDGRRFIHSVIIIIKHFQSKNHSQPGLNRSQRNGFPVGSPLIPNRAHWVPTRKHPGHSLEFYRGFQAKARKNLAPHGSLWLGGLNHLGGSHLEFPLFPFNRGRGCSFNKVPLTGLFAFKGSQLELGH